MRKYTTLAYIEYPVATGNYSESGRLPVTQIIIHSTVSPYMSAVNYFNNPNAGTSAHYVISNKGEIAAMLEEYYVAYHSGNLTVNQKSIGIEHEWYQGMVIDNALYKKSAQLVADICREYKLSCNRGTVKGHKEIVPTGCPNLIDVDRIVREAQAILNPTPIPSPTIPDNITRKASYFDLYWHAMYGDAIDTDKVTKAQVEARIKEAKSEKLRGGEWDKLAKLTGYTGDTSELIAQQLYDRVNTSLQKEIHLLLAERPKLRQLAIDECIKKLQEIR
jgi:hypothetical protein